MLSKENNNAPIHTWTVLLALALILLLAGTVCVLHYVNAVSLYEKTVILQQEMGDGSKQKLVSIVEEPWEQAGVIHIMGALMRMDQRTESVNVRVALIPEYNANADTDYLEAFVIKTQMSRRFDYAKQYGVDDHCGFHATVRRTELDAGDLKCYIVLIDETADGRRVIETGAWLVDTDEGLRCIHNELRIPEGRN